MASSLMIYVVVEDGRCWREVESKVGNAGAIGNVDEGEGIDIVRECG